MTAQNNAGPSYYANALTYSCFLWQKRQSAGCLQDHFVTHTSYFHQFSPLYSPKILLYLEKHHHFCHEIMTRNILKTFHGNFPFWMYLMLKTHLAGKKISWCNSEKATGELLHLRNAGFLNSSLIKTEKKISKRGFGTCLKKTKKTTNTHTHTHTNSKTIKHVFITKMNAQVIACHTSPRIAKLC